MDSSENKEYLCPFCKVWVNFDAFTAHEKTHYNMDYRGMSKPKSLEELKNRMESIGLWEEKCLG
jgi:hypothetical protein